MKADSRAVDLQDFRTIESKLKYSLRPVAPRQEFVLDLQQRLNQQFHMLPALTRFSLSYFIWIGLTILLALVMFFAVSVRLLVFVATLFSLLKKPARPANNP